MVSKDNIAFENRRDHAYAVRLQAATIARDRVHPEHQTNNEELDYTTIYATSGNDCSHSTYIASFTKGLPHHRQTGLLLAPTSYNIFRDSIATGDTSLIASLPLGPPNGETFASGIASSRSTPVSVRAWESMSAGLIYDLQGPDSHAVTIPPAPRLDSPELAYEMSELYWMSLLRDISFVDFEYDDGVAEAVESLNATAWISIEDAEIECLEPYQKNRLRAPLTPETVFRGALQGDDIGPYISQFLLRGAGGIGGLYKPSDGKVPFGAAALDQRVRVAPAGRDYMTTWASWLDVQNGADLRGYTQHISEEDEEPVYRFITTPRDLATYVHFDALYQAYLTACLLLLAMKVPYDPSLPFIQEDSIDKQQGFAHFGSPHILCLVTEVSTRALKAVRYQKFNVHRRLRPEAVGGLLERVQYCEEDDAELFKPVRPLYEALDEDLLQRVREHNAEQNELCDGDMKREEDYSPTEESKETLLLSMGYAEGSPMHPSYGAGHATVAGACVTILKAFFDCSYELEQTFVPNNEGSELEEMEMETKLTIEGELNKLCSNVSIGRNWAGVHYYSDYIESIRLGESVAIGILEEQKITYGEEFKMSIPLFDGTIREI